MKFKCLLLSVSILAAFSCAKENLPASTASGDGNGNYMDNTDVIPGWIRVKIAENAAPLSVGVFTRGATDSGNEQLDRVASSLGATEIKHVFNEGGKFAERRRRYGMHLWYDIKIDESVPVSRAGRAVSEVDGVEIVEPIVKTVMSDYTMTPDISEHTYSPATVKAASSAGEEMPFNDPDLSKQWHYHNDGSIDNSVAGADINVFKAWRDITAGKPEVIIAVIDGGIQVDHPDLAANMWINEAELNGTPGVDDDNNGYKDDVYGWNIYTNSGTITPHPHGTHVAGTVAAVNNNGIGVCGVAGGTGNGDGVRLMSCQGYVILSNGDEVGSIQPDLFVYAADNGAVIAQNSWGYSGSMPQAMKTAIEYFIREAGTDDNGNQTGPMKGGVACFAGGNSSISSIEAPANMDGVIAVTAMDPNYRKSAYSNYGDKASILAPGGARVPTSEAAWNPRQVYSTSINDGYAYLYGTSMATPHVSGVVGLIVSYYGVGRSGFTADDCKKILLSSYRPIGQYVDEEYTEKLGVGLLDASLITLPDVTKAPEKVSDASFTALNDDVVVKFTTPADANGNSIASVHIDYAVKSGDTSSVEEWVENTYRNTTLPGAEFKKQFALIGGTTYIFRIYAEDRYGNKSESVTQTATPLPHINVSPTVSHIDNVLITSTGSMFITKVDLAKYFTDPDGDYGDYLTYKVENESPDYVSCILDGSELTFTPIYKGNSNITVTATDTHGESATGSFIVKVLGGKEKPTQEEDKKSEPDKAVMSVYSNPVSDILNITFTYMYNESGRVRIYDSAGRMLGDSSVVIDENGKSTLNVVSLMPGTYTMLCNVLSREFKSTFIKK